ncbi:MAG: hypothetical protein IJV70_00790, partial [Clostridia bacterium]|nr:hypothetical protein [Clostridia bacterium]
SFVATETALAREDIKNAENTVKAPSIAPATDDTLAREDIKNAGNTVKAPSILPATEDTLAKEEIGNAENTVKAPSISPATEDTLAKENIKNAENTVETPNLSPAVTDGLRALLSENISLFNEIAKKNNMLPSAFADKINEELFDMIGDSVIENDGFEIRLSEFYREDVEDIVN